MIFQRYTLFLSTIFLCMPLILRAAQTVEPSFNQDFNTCASFLMHEIDSWADYFEEKSLAKKSLSSSIESAKNIPQVYSYCNICESWTQKKSFLRHLQSTMHLSRIPVFYKKFQEEAHQELTDLSWLTTIDPLSLLEQ